MSSEADHIVAIVNTFVQARYRERLRLKPRQFVDDLFHALPPKLDAGLVVRVDSLRKQGSSSTPCGRSAGASRRG